MTGQLNINRLREFPMWRALLVLFGALLFGLVVSAFCSGWLGSAAGWEAPAVMKTATVMQNALMFMVPALLTGFVFYGKAFRFVGLSKKPPMSAIVWMLVVYVAMTPAMNWLVAWNASVSLPESMAPLEQWLKTQEMAAQEATSQVVDVSSPFDLCLTILLVGILTGLCEETFFRGALQQIFICGTKKGHLAVWISALIFSAMHFQFYGFVPRLVLGAFFGYMYLWSGSLWVPVVGHAINNTAVVVLIWLKEQGTASSIDSVGVAESGVPYAAIASVLATLALMIVFRAYNARGNG